MTNKIPTYTKIIDINGYRAIGKTGKKQSKKNSKSSKDEFIFVNHEQCFVDATIL